MPHSCAMQAQSAWAWSLASLLILEDLHKLSAIVVQPGHAERGLHREKLQPLQPFGQPPELLRPPHALLDTQSSSKGLGVMPGAQAPSGHHEQPLFLTLRQLPGPVRVSRPEGRLYRRETCKRCLPGPPLPPPPLRAACSRGRLSAAMARRSSLPAALREARPRL